ncbi:hypothetical protein ANO11243_013650 [Dothideomycetidae sp. 11243]|nr:hypothetical protein ANO11243_013650 [fungal sp. No.11243]
MAEVPDLYRIVDALPTDRARAFWELAAYKRRHEEVDWISAIRSSYSGPSADFDTHCDRVLHAWQIYETNRFTVRSSSGARDQMGMFPRAARLNHSCSPNVFHRHNHRINRLTIHALKDIPAGAELCTSYIDIVHPTAERRRLLRHWGFKCGCTQCRSHSASSELRRTKLEDAFSRVRRDAAARSQRSQIPKWDYARALDALEAVLGLMAEEGLDETDTSAEVLGLAVDCALALGWAGQARDWAAQALEVEARSLGEDSEEWQVARERLREAEAAFSAQKEN